MAEPAPPRLRALSLVTEPLRIDPDALTLALTPSDTLAYAHHLTLDLTLLGPSFELRGLDLVAVVRDPEADDALRWATRCSGPDRLAPHARAPLRLRLPAPALPPHAHLILSARYHVMLDATVACFTRDADGQLLPQPVDALPALDTLETRWRLHADGDQHLLSGLLHHRGRSPLDFIHLRAEGTRDGHTVAQATATLRNVAPGQLRPLELSFTRARQRAAEATRFEVRVELSGATAQPLAHLELAPPPPQESP